jgi:uncharacterized membrane protein
MISLSPLKLQVRGDVESQVIKRTETLHSQPGMILVEGRELHPNPKKMRNLIH